MTSEFEDLARQFILNEDLEDKDIKDLVTRILKFCKIDSKGFVIIHDTKLRTYDKIHLVLCAKYLANRLQLKSGKEVTIQESAHIKEITNILRENDAVVAARLKDLKDAKKVLPQDKGVYKAAPYAINDFIIKLELESVKNE